MQRRKRNYRKLNRNPLRLEALEHRMLFTGDVDLLDFGVCLPNPPAAPVAAQVATVSPTARASLPTASIEENTFETDTSVAIGNFETARSSIVVDDVPGDLIDVNVTLDITHTWVGDLYAFLISPAGTRIELFTDVGNDSNGNNFTDTTLDDEAAESIADNDVPFTGSFRPEGRLSDLDGENPNGTWTLEIEDRVDGDVGTLNRWSLRLTTRDAAHVRSLSAPSRIAHGDSLTLSAEDVDGGSTAVDQVDFYRDSNGDGVLEEGIDQHLGTDASSGDGWTWNVSTAAMDLGLQRFFAVATSAAGLVSEPALASTSVVVSAYA